MISITTMMIVATIQSSIDKMVPKTSYLKVNREIILHGFLVIYLIHLLLDVHELYICRIVHRFKRKTIFEQIYKSFKTDFLN